MAITIGTQLGAYEITALLGKGGMGEVYRATDKRLDRTVAIKVLRVQLSANSEMRERFEREARAVASLNHPNVCVLHDVGRHEDIDFLVLEFIEGTTLSNRLEKGPLPVEEAIRHSIQIADALNVAHRKGIIHRDLKPGNVMITAAGIKL